MPFKDKRIDFFFYSSFVNSTAPLGAINKFTDIIKNPKRKTIS